MAELQDEIQKLPLLKQALAAAESKPRGCALALSKDRKEVLVLVDRRMKPKKVGDQLKKDAKAIFEPSTLRFGRVSFDPADPGTVRFNIHKPEPGGMIMHTVKLMKRAGYQAAVFHVNEDLENEEADGEESDDDETKPQVSPQGTAPTSVAPPPPPPPPPPPQPPVDINGLRAALATLIPRIPLAPTDKQGPLKELAVKAGTAVKANDADTAGTAIDALRQQLDALGTSTPVDAPKPGAAASQATYAKSRLAWMATRQRVEADLKKLGAELQKTYADLPEGPAIVQAYDSKIAPVLTRFDTRLADALDGATNSADPTERSKQVGEARKLIGEYKSYLEGEALLESLDVNPFVPLGIRALVGNTLKALEAAVA